MWGFWALGIRQHARRNVPTTHGTNRAVNSVSDVAHYTATNTASRILSNSLPRPTRGYLTIQSSKFLTHSSVFLSFCLLSGYWSGFPRLATPALSRNWRTFAVLQHVRQIASRRTFWTGRPPWRHPRIHRHDGTGAMTAAIIALLLAAICNHQFSSSSSFLHFSRRALPTYPTKFFGVIDLND